MDNKEKMEAAIEYGIQSKRNGSKSKYARSFISLMMKQAPETKEDMLHQFLKGFNSRVTQNAFVVVDAYDNMQVNTISDFRETSIEKAVAVFGRSWKTLLSEGHAVIRVSITEK